MLENLRFKWAKKIIAKKQKLRKNKSYVSINSCKKIKIIFELNSIDELAFYNSFVEDMRMRGISVVGLGYCSFESSMPKDDKFFFLNSTQLNWLKLPKKAIRPSIEALNEEDLLIDLNLNYNVPTAYVAACSNAKMKVGRKIVDKEWLDLQICIDGEDSVKYLSELIIHYLACIKETKSQES